MSNKLSITYSLLSFLKENNNYGIYDIFIPIIKKTLSDNCEETKGQSITEIQKMVINAFSLEIPIPVLKFLLEKIVTEISNKDIALYNDNSFIIKSYIFQEIDEQISIEESEIGKLESDFKGFCSLHNTNEDFENLIKFITAQNIELFTDKKSEYLDTSYVIAKYIKSRINDSFIFKKITDIYLGSLLSSYISFKISKPISDCELLIDTNFFISLIDLNTEDSYTICNQLYNICFKLGYRFSILYCTVEQIKILLNSRIASFDNKEYLGSIKNADIFDACIRKGYNRSNLEKIRDSIDKILIDKRITIIHEPQIKEIVKNAKRSEEYLELLKKREFEASALNDAIAKLYVKKNRGEIISEFNDVKCWFLHNSLNPHQYKSHHKISDSTSISASDLLVILWLSNPSQEINIEKNQISRNILSSYVTRYRGNKIPTTKTLLEIKRRSDLFCQSGNITEEDMFKIGVRMSEGSITKEETEGLLELNNEQFSEKIKELSKEFNDIQDNFNKSIIEKDNKINDLDKQIRKLAREFEIIKNERDSKNTEIEIIRKELEQEREKRKQQYINESIRKWQRKGITTAIITAIILAIIITLYFVLKHHQIINLNSSIIDIVVPSISTFIETLIIKNTAERYKASEIQAYKSNIELPPELTRI